MSSTDHPFVAEYLARFEAESNGIREPRRSVLREEISAHLRDAIPLSASDAEAAAVIASFGSPAEIIGQELSGSAGQEPAAADGRELERSANRDVEAGRRQEPAPQAAQQLEATPFPRPGKASEATPPSQPDPRRRDRRNVLALGAGVAALAVLLAMLLFWLWSPGMSPQHRPVTPIPTPSPTAGASVVTEAPKGPERITTGTGYYEYLAAIEAMEHPLPEGAAYPLGVPAGLDEGQAPSGVMEAGAGAAVANFTWLCAWEAEYLDAVDGGDDRRRVEAESMITAWSTSDFFLTIGGSQGWVENVLDSMRFGNPSGVESDFPGTCAQASIFDVANR